MGAFVVVPPQEVSPEIVFEIPPDGMDMVCPVLRVKRQPLCDVRRPTAHLISIIVRTMVLSCACKRYTYKPLGKLPAPKRTV